MSAAPRLQHLAGTSVSAASFLSGRAKDRFMLGTILIIILILLLLGALPSWPYSSGWGYYPSGGLGLVLVIIVILVLLGRI
jgi:hypothetical protein